MLSEDHIRIRQLEELGIEYNHDIAPLILVFLRILLSGQEAQTADLKDSFKADDDKSIAILLGVNLDDEGKKIVEEAKNKIASVFVRLFPHNSMFILEKFLEFLEGMMNQATESPTASK